MQLKSPPDRRAPRCRCGGPLDVHVSVGPGGRPVIWARCEAGHVKAPYDGPLTARAELELAMLRDTWDG